MIISFIKEVSVIYQKGVFMHSRFLEGDSMNKKYRYETDSVLVLDDALLTVPVMPIQAEITMRPPGVRPPRFCNKDWDIEYLRQCHEARVAPFSRTQYVYHPGEKRFNITDDDPSLDKSSKARPGIRERLKTLQRTLEVQEVSFTIEPYAYPEQGYELFLKEHFNHYSCKGYVVSWAAIWFSCFSGDGTIVKLSSAWMDTQGDTRKLELALADWEGVEYLTQEQQESLKHWIGDLKTNYPDSRNPQQSLTLLHKE